MIEEFLGYLSNFWEFIKRNKKACFIIRMKINIVFDVCLFLYSHLVLP